jgi:hypothetical protein
VSFSIKGSNDESYAHAVKNADYSKRRGKNKDQIFHFSRTTREKWKV